ncbi:hypothetical protein C8R43DRAFT_942784 [Mycena crocata]|nr:hypothetical protein C8R43DRAFT_942784 [Mycena crocata]
MPRWSAFCPRITVFLPHDCLFGGSIAHADGRPSLGPPVNNADGWGEKTTYRIAMLTDFREKVVYINGQNQPKWIGHSSSSYATLLWFHGLAWFQKSQARNKSQLKPGLVWLLKPWLGLAWFLL